MRSHLIWITTAVLASTACERQKVVERPLTAVRTVAAEAAPVPNEVRYSGVVVPDTQVDLAFRVSGFIEQIGHVREGGRSRELQEGDFVSAGAKLARLRSSEYQTRVSYAQSVSADAGASLSALRAQLNESDAALVQAKRDFERARNLYADKALTKADFDAAEARHDSAVARRAAMEAQIAAQQARIDGASAQHRDAAISFNDTALIAPFPGVIIAKKIARGSLMSAGTPAFTVADIRVAKVSFGVPDLGLRGFKLGDTLAVTAEAAPGREFQGRVSSIAPSADSASRVFAVQVSIPNVGQELKVGMVATVRVAGEQDESPLPAIPLAAVVKSGSASGGYGVYAIDSRDGGDRVRLQPVRLGPVRGNSVIITAGLNQGQRIVATGGLQLADGERVRQIP